MLFEIQRLKMFKLDLHMKESLLGLEDYDNNPVTREVQSFKNDIISLEKIVLKVDSEKHYEIKKIMQVCMPNVRIDSNLVRDIDYYLKSYINKNDEHISFFGSNLTGVNKITFTTDDRNEWCIDLLGIDEIDIKKRIKQLPHIGDTWVRGTDGMNISLLYLVHLLHLSKLPEKDKKRTIVNCLIILQIKFLSSLLHGYFKYPVSEKLALAVYDQLSRKFYIKKYGTWLKILEARAEDICDKTSTHYATIETFETDERIQYMITDIQTRIKSMILNIYEVTVRLKDKGVGVGSQAMLVEQFGKIEVRDVEKNFDNYLNYINNVIPEPRSFIKAELINVISDSITTMPAQLLNDLLNVISELGRKDDRKLNEMVREIMIYLFDYLRANRRAADDLSNLGQLIISIKSLFTASKTNSVTVLQLRDYFDNLVKKNIKSKTPATISGVRTGIILYIILRTLTKHHYE